MLEVPGEWDITSQLRTLEGTLHCSAGPNAHVCAFAAFAVCRICRLPHCRLPHCRLRVCNTRLPFARLPHARLPHFTSHSSSDAWNPRKRTWLQHAVAIQQLGVQNIEAFLRFTAASVKHVNNILWFAYWWTLSDDHIAIAERKLRVQNKVEIVIPKICLLLSETTKIIYETHLCSVFHTENRHATRRWHNIVRSPLTYCNIVRWPLTCQTLVTMMQTFCMNLTAVKILLFGCHKFRSHVILCTLEMERSCAMELERSCAMSLEGHWRGQLERSCAITCRPGTSISCVSRDVRLNQKRSSEQQE